MKSARWFCRFYAD